PARTRVSPSESTSGNKCLALRTKESHTGRHVKELTLGVHTKSLLQFTSTRHVARFEERGARSGCLRWLLFVRHVAQRLHTAPRAHNLSAKAQNRPFGQNRGTRGKSKRGTWPNPVHRRLESGPRRLTRNAARLRNFVLTPRAMPATLISAADRQEFA